MRMLYEKYICPYKDCENNKLVKNIINYFYNLFKHVKFILGYSI